MNINHSTPRIHNNKQLFTLHQSSDKSAQSPSESESVYPMLQQQQSDTSKLRKKVRQLQKKQSILMAEISELENQYEFISQRNQKTEEKNKELIQKLSYQQIQNKQLRFQNHKLEGDNQQLIKNIESMKTEYYEMEHKYAQMEQKNKNFVVILQNIYESIKKCRTQDTFQKNINKFKQLLEKSIKFIIDDQQTSIILQKISNEDIKQGDFLRKIRDLTEQKQKLKDELQQKKKILPSYIEVLNKLRQNCAQLKHKVDDIYSKSEQDKLSYQKTIADKDYLLDQMHHKNQELFKLLQKCEERQQFLRVQLEDFLKEEKKGQLRQSMLNRESLNKTKKSFIGDTKKTRLKKQLDNIDEQILRIQHNLIKQLKQNP